MNKNPPTATANTPVDTRVFRRACSAFPTGITIITAQDPHGKPVGVTVNSFTSVSLTPPMVLWTVGDTARSFSAFCTASHYAVHILRKTQQDLAELFASPSDNKFASLNWHSSTYGLPILPDFSACLECRVENVYPCGKQNLLVGQVLRIEDRQGQDALVYFRSQFQQLG